MKAHAGEVVGHLVDEARGALHAVPRGHVEVVLAQPLKMPGLQFRQYARIVHGIGAVVVQ